jgi:hypothetical protein
MITFLQWMQLRETDTKPVVQDDDDYFDDDDHFGFRVMPIITEEASA